MSLVYLKGLETLTSNGGAAWDDAGSDLRAVLMSASHTEDQTDEWLSDVNANIISQAPTPAVLASSTVSIDIPNLRVELDTADLVFASVGAGDLPSFVVIYLNTGNPATSALICSLTLTSPPAPDGGSYTAIIGADGAVQLMNA